jgi:hypothetical protein
LACDAAAADWYVIAIEWDDWRLGAEDEIAIWKVEYYGVAIIGLTAAQRDF